MQLIEEKPNSLLLKWFGTLSRYGIIATAFSLALCLFLSGGLGFLNENSDGRIFFDPASDERLDLSALEQSFTETNSLLFVISTDRETLFDSQALDAILHLTEQAWQIPYVTRVNSLSNFQRISSEDDDVIIESLISPESLGDPDSLGEMREYALSDRDLVGSILSADGKTTAIALNIAVPRGDSAAVKRVMDAVRELESKARADYEGLTYHITGDAALDAAFSEAYAYDLKTVFPIFLIIIFVVSIYFFRSVILSCLLLFMMCLVVGATMGAAGYMGIELTAGTSGVPIILITISLADFIHILSTVRLNIQGGQQKKTAIHNALEENFLPVALTSFTTFIGFISLNFNDAPPFQDMGNLVALGIGICFLLTFTFFPTVLLKLDIARIFSGERRGGVNYSRFSAPYAKFLHEKRSFIMVVMILLAIFVCRGIGHIELDDDWVKYFDTNNRFRQDTEFVVAHLTGVDTIEYRVTSNVEGGVANADFLRNLNQFELWARHQPEITHVSSIVSIFKKMNKHMGTGRQDQDGLSENSDLNAQYLLLYEMSLPLGLDLNDRIDISKEATRLSVTGRDLTSRDMRELDQKVTTKLQSMGLLGPNMSGTGVPLLFAHLSERNIQSMLIGIGFAIGLVSLILTLVFRSISLGLISFTVNILPILMGFGLWGWLYQYVGLSLTVVAAIAFGIVVDDSIHFITKYRKSLEKNKNNSLEALAETYNDVGGALVMTTLMLAMGFAVLSLSSFQPTWALGLISAVMIIIALVYDFFLLPAILVMFPSIK